MTLSDDKILEDVHSWLSTRLGYLALLAWVVSGVFSPFVATHDEGTPTASFDCVER